MYAWKDKAWLAVSIITWEDGNYEVDAGLWYSKIQPEHNRWFSHSNHHGLLGVPPRFGGASERLLELVRDAHMIAAHDWPRVDAFMRDAVGEQWTKTIEGRVIIDTLVLVREPRIGVRRRGRDPYRLESVARRLTLTTRAWPRGCANVNLILGIIERCVAWLPDDGHEMATMIAQNRDAQERRDMVRVAQRPRSPAGRWLPTTTSVSSGPDSGP